MPATGRYRHVALIGLMGVGKTTVGRELSVLLGWPLSDSDEAIERARGMTVRELSESLGVTAMHELEAEHLLQALDGSEHSVVCAASSVVEDQRCRLALRRPAVLTAWLQGDPAVLAGRFAEGGYRPLLASDPEALLRGQLQQRGYLFGEASDIRISTATHTPQEVAKTLAELIT